MITLCYVCLLWLGSELQKSKSTWKHKMPCSNYRIFLENWEQKQEEQQILSISRLYIHWCPKYTPAYHTAYKEATSLPRLNRYTVLCKLPGGKTLAWQLIQRKQIIFWAVSHLFYHPEISITIKCMFYSWNRLICIYEKKYMHISP